MTSLALSFNNVNFSPVEHDNQIWLTASELAKALGYKKSDAVTQVYERNADEFTPEMTTTLKLSVVRKTGNVQMENRIFNSRGCHLIAMFAKTDIAKQFRKWVLDVLDKVAGSPKVVTNEQTTKEEREPLTSAVNLLVAKTKHLNYSEAYKLVHQRFNVEHINEIPYDALNIAVEYVHYLIVLYSKADAHQFKHFGQIEYELVRKLAEAVVKENDEIVSILLAVKIIDEKKFCHHALRIARINECVRDVSYALDFRNELNEPLIDKNCRVIALSTGEKLLVRPNWFNCPS